MKIRNKNIDIELMRYLMILAVAILHFGEDFCGEMRTLRGGALGVDFFFIIGGFFLAQHYFNYKTDEPPFIQANKYFISRIKRLYPAYFISLILICFIFFCENNFSLIWLKEHLYQTKWQYVFLHFICPNVPFDLRSIWYISSFVFVMYIIYFLLSYNEKLMMGVFPIMSLIIFSHIYTTYGTICIQGVWEGWIYGGTMRAFSEMGLGVFMYGNISYLQQNNIKLKSTIVRLVATIGKWMSLVMIFWQMHVYAIDVNDFVKIALFIIYIHLSYMNCYEFHISIIDKIVLWLGSINYWIFSLHLIVSYLIVKFMKGTNYYVVLIVFLISITVIASVCQLIENQIMNKRKS